MAHPVAQVRAERYATSEIVISFDLLAPSAALSLTFYQNQFQRFALAGGAFDDRRFAGPRCVCPSWTPPAQPPQIGEIQESFGLESLQQLAALVEIGRASCRERV